MLTEKAGVTAGIIWGTLNGTDGLTYKSLKKATKVKADKDLYLGIGWLLREDKLAVSEQADDLFFTLK